MSRSPSKRQGIDLPKCQEFPLTSPSQAVDGPVASRRTPRATQQQAGADDEMNPTITTGTASYMGVDQTITTGSIQQPI